MSIEVISIGSSSSGNSYIVKAGDKTILLDVGLTAKKIVAALDAEDLSVEDVDAVLITHEHVDHVKSVRAISRKCCNAGFYATRGTVESTENFKYVPEDRLHIITAGDTFTLGTRADAPEVSVTAFALSHDASEPTGYSIRCGAEKLSVVTDTGIITNDIYSEIRDSGMLVFEANHDEDLLLFGEYPYPVKVRIKSDFGHLSNRCAGEALARLLDDRSSREVREPLRVMLAHLSFHNNAPFYARTTIENILKEKGYERDIHYTLSIASKDETTILL